MSMPGGSAREAAERNAQAIMSGNLAQVMADITPEALAQVMQMGAAAGGVNPAAMPGITGYDVAPSAADGETETFDVTFHAAIGKATLGITWKPVMGQWKISAVSLVSLEPAPPA
ncbi:MAG: hypothetical protein HY875_07110 [Chloroflexi bacterium]|nr:hypothetical protein [Chloroflexota bacterium]